MGTFNFNFFFLFIQHPEVDGLPARPMGGQPSSEQSPSSSSEDIPIQGKPQSQPIKTPKKNNDESEEQANTPHSLTDRVLAMVNPRVPVEQSISQRPDSKPAPIETVPTAFKWSHGGERVFVTGGFNNWQGKIMMHRNEDNPKEFVLVIDIPPGTHQYKFIVDDEWRLNPDSPKVVCSGVTNNEVDVKRPVFEHISSPFDDSDDDDVDDQGRPVQYGQVIPGAEVYAANPPKAPPHLGQSNIILNKVSDKGDPYVLGIPGHEMLNHVIVNGNGNEKSDVLITSITQRFRTKPSISVTPKFVTL